jgi:hypothetical protein
VDGEAAIDGESCSDDKTGAGAAQPQHGRRDLVRRPQSADGLFLDDPGHRHSRGRKVVNHPAVGPMELAYDDFALPGDPYISTTTYTADPGTPSADGLAMLATWAATQQQPQTSTDDVRRTGPRPRWVRQERGRAVRGAAPASRRCHTRVALFTDGIGGRCRYS